MTGRAHCDLKNCFNHHSDLHIAEIKTDEQINIGKGFIKRSYGESNYSDPHVSSAAEHLPTFGVFLLQKLCTRLPMHRASLDLYSYLLLRPRNASHHGLIHLGYVTLGWCVWA